MAAVPAFWSAIGGTCANPHHWLEAGDGEGWLLLDDLVDTGTTARVVRSLLPKAHFATVYAKPAGKPMVDTYVTEVSQDTWIMFPWDTEPQFVRPIVAPR